MWPSQPEKKLSWRPMKTHESKPLEIIWPSHPAKQSPGKQMEMTAILWQKSGQAIQQSHHVGHI